MVVNTLFSSQFAITARQLTRPDGQPDMGKHLAEGVLYRVKVLTMRTLLHLRQDRNPVWAIESGDILRAQFESGSVSRGKTVVNSARRLTSEQLMACSSAYCKSVCDSEGEPRHDSRPNLRRGSCPYDKQYRFQRYRCNPHHRCKHLKSASTSPSLWFSVRTYSLTTVHSLFPSVRLLLHSHPSPMSKPRPGNKRLDAIPKCWSD
jgi:hypothetical protein